MNCVYEEDLQLVMGKWNTLVQGIPVTFEMRWKSKVLEEKDGSGAVSQVKSSPVWISAACIPFTADDGTLISISGFTTNISAKKESEQHILDRAEAIERAEVSEHRFAVFVELAPVGIWMVDPTYQVCQLVRTIRETLLIGGQVIYGNDKYFEFLGSPRIPYVNVAWSDFVLPEDLHSLLESFQAITDTKKPQTFEFRFKRPWIGGDGIIGESWATAAAYPDLDQDGNIREILGTLSDISRYKWAETVQKQRVHEVLELKRQQEKYEFLVLLIGQLADCI